LLPGKGRGFFDNGSGTHTLLSRKVSCASTIAPHAVQRRV
jgi:hypothetical protein